MKKQKDGRYRIKITVGHDADGKPLYKYAAGRTQREAKAEADRLKQYYIDGIDETRLSTLFGPYLVEWYRVYKEPHIGASSKRSYATVINRHILPAFEDRQIKAIRAAELQEFMNSKAKMSKTVTGYMMTVLQGVFTRAAVDGIIMRDPTAGLIQRYAPRDAKRALTDQETDATLDVIQSHPDGLLLALLYFTGVRRGEALGLQWQDIDFTGRWLHVERDVDFVTNALGEVKTENAIRDIPIPDGLYNILQARRGIGKNFVLPSAMGRNFIGESSYERKWDGLMRELAKADPSIEQADGQSILTAGYFRHNYASILYDAGVDVLTAQRFLGHADPATTLRIYTHLSRQRERAGNAKVREAFSVLVAKKLPEEETSGI